VETRILDQRLRAIAERGRFAPKLVERLGHFVRTASDEDLLRINPLRFARDRAIDEQDAIDLFVHGAHAGVFDLSWGIVCEYCAGYLTTAGGIRSIARARACALCAAKVHGSMDDTVEVTFTVAPATRKIRYHNLRSPSRDDIMRVYFSPSVTLSPQFRRWIHDSWIRVRSLPARAAVTLSLNLAPGQYALITNENHTRTVVRVGARGADRVDVDLLEGQFVPGDVLLRAGRVSLRVRTGRASRRASSSPGSPARTI
jgi:hypothetical protein